MVTPGTCLGNTREAGFKEKIIGSIRHVEFDGAYIGFAGQILTVGIWIDGLWFRRTVSLELKVWGLSVGKYR